MKSIFMFIVNSYVSVICDTNSIANFANIGILLIYFAVKYLSF